MENGLSFYQIVQQQHGTSGKESSCLIQETQERWVHPWVRKISFSRKWHPTPVFLPGKSHRQRSLVGYSPWGCKEWDMTEQQSIIEYSQKKKKPKSHLNSQPKFSPYTKLNLKVNHRFKCKTRKLFRSFMQEKIFFCLFLIGGKLLYNVVLVSAIQQHK